MSHVVVTTIVAIGLFGGDRNVVVVAILRTCNGIVTIVIQSALTQDAEHVVVGEVLAGLIFQPADGLAVARPVRDRAQGASTPAGGVRTQRRVVGAVLFFAANVVAS